MIKLQESAMRILFILGSLRKGGSERVISLLANRYSEIGNEITIITLLSDGVEYSLNKDINIIHLNIKKNKSFFYNKARATLKEIITNFNPDKILSFSTKVNVFVLATTRIYRNFEVIVSERNNSRKGVYNNPLFRLLVNILYKKADVIVFQTNDVLNFFPKYLHKKSTVLENPITENLPLCSYSGSNLISVGRLAPQKNHKELINALALVKKKHPDIVLNIYGEGDGREQLEKQIRKMNLSNNVFLKGRVDDVFSKISESKLFIITSKYEGFSNALLEAMAIGIPCIGPNIVGVKNIIENGVTGCLYQSGNEKELGELIIDMFTNYSRAKEIGMKARVEINDQYRNQVLNGWDNLLLK